MTYRVTTEAYASRPYGDLLVDIHHDERPTRVAVVFLHGGGWRVGSRESISPGIDDLRPTVFERMVEAGITVVSADYRLSDVAQWPAQLDDVLELAAWMSDDARTWRGRYRAWGASAGGHLALHLALQARPSNRPRSVVSWFAPTNLATLAEQAHPASVVDPISPDSREAQLLGVRPVDDPVLAEAASPVSLVHADSPRTLLMHGDADRFVPWQQATELRDALLAAGAQVELDIVPGADHFWNGIDATESVLPRTIRFLLAS